MAGIRYVFTVEAGTMTAVQVQTVHQDRAKTCQSIINLFTGIDAGNWRAGRVEVSQGAGVPGATPLGVAASAQITYSGSAGAQTIVLSSPGVAATGTLTIAGGAGAVGGTIGGTLVTVTWATSDTATAAALAAAINANATTNQYVFATSAAGVVTLRSLSSTTAGNGTTLVASGTGVTASGPKLTGGTVTSTTVSFQAGATDAATVQNAIAAIRASAPAMGLVFIPTPPNYGATINTAGVLTIWANTIPVANALGNAMIVAVTGTGASVTTEVFSGGINSGPNGFSV